MSDDTLLPVLDVLADGGLHSGEAMAQRFGISRAALAKRVDHLRDWGLDISAVAGAGYRLAAPLQRLDAAEIRHALTGAARGALGPDLPALMTRQDATAEALLAAGIERPGYLPGGESSLFVPKKVRPGGVFRPLYEAPAWSITFRVTTSALPSIRRL